MTKEISNHELEAFILVGGKGTRLAEVTGGTLSKGRVPINSEGDITCIDYISDLLTRLHMPNVHLLTRHNSQQYEDVSTERGYNLLFQKKETGTSGAVEEAILENGMDKQYLVMSVDTLLSERDLSNVIQTHTPGTITWGVSRNQFPSMEPYNGLVVDDQTNAVIGDTKTLWWKDWNLEGKSIYVKGAVQIIDPYVYMHGVEVYKRLSKKTILSIYIGTLCH